MHSNNPFGVRELLGRQGISTGQHQRFPTPVHRKSAPSAMSTFIVFAFFTLHSRVRLQQTTDTGWQRSIRYRTNIDTETGNSLIADLWVHGSSSTSILPEGSVAAKALLHVNRRVKLLFLNFASSPFDDGTLPYLLGCFALVGRVVTLGGGHGEEMDFTVSVNMAASRTENRRIVR
jgi:hypothetical protein